MPSALYDILRATALECFDSMENIDQDRPQLQSQSQSKPQQNNESTKYDVSESRIRAVRTDDYIQEYGHGYMVKIAKPGHYVPLTTDSLITHLRAAGPAFKSVRTEIKRVAVDEVTLEVAVWMTIWITVGGNASDGNESQEGGVEVLDEEVEYEMAWFYEMVGDERGMRVRKATEFVDGYAADRVAELVALRSGKATA